MPKVQANLVNVVTIPPTNVGVGTFGPVSSANLASDVTQFVVGITPINWPASGTVMVLTIEESNDAGQTWRFSASEDLAGGPWLDKQGNVIPSETWVTTLMYQGGTERRVRITVTCLQACRVSGSVGVQ